MFYNTRESGLLFPFLDHICTYSSVSNKRHLLLLNYSYTFSNPPQKLQTVTQKNVDCCFPFYIYIYHPAVLL